MTKHICIVVPTYPGHYLYASNFENSFRQFHMDEQADLVFVFTNQQEKDVFFPCNAIILPEKLRIMKNRGIVNIKKFYALMQLKSKYDYIIVLDDDCKFIAEADLASICEEYFNRKVLYGNLLKNPPFDIMGNIAEGCKRFFEVPEKISCPLYLWWNQLCIYKTDTLSAFFQATKIDRKIASLKWEDFDYYIYMYYLILFHDFKIEDIGVISDAAFVEILPNSYYEYTPGTHISKKFFKMTNYARKVFNVENVFIEIHLDRAEELEIHVDCVEELEIHLDRAEELEIHVDCVEELEIHVDCVEELEIHLDCAEELEIHVDCAEELETSLVKESKIKRIVKSVAGFFRAPK